MNEAVVREEELAVGNKKVNLRKVTILIVDPNEFSRTFIKSICRNLHFGNILTTANTNEAFELLKANAVHLIVCDWALAPLSSIEFSKQVRNSQMANNAVPIIILTSTGSPEAIVAARDAGVDDYLTRPIVMRRLLNSFVSVLCLPRTFIKSKTYVGPNRRRKKMPHNGPERRAGWPGYQGAAVPKPEEAAVITEAPAEKETAPDTSEDQTGASIEEMEKAGEAAIAQEADNYSKVRLDDIAEIFDLVRQIKQPNAQMNNILGRIYTKALDVKGMGNTFGYPLLTKVGDLLCNFVHDPDPDSFKVLAKLQVVETHAIIMKMIVDSNMHDENDELAKELIDELMVMMKKFKGPATT